MWQAVFQGLNILMHLILRCKWQSKVMHTVSEKCLDLSSLTPGPTVKPLHGSVISFVIYDGSKLMHCMMSTRGRNSRLAHVTTTLLHCSILLVLKRLESQKAHFQDSLAARVLFMLQPLSRWFSCLRLEVCGSVGKEAKAFGSSVVASLVFNVIVAEWGQWQQQ